MTQETKVTVVLYFLSDGYSSVTLDMIASICTNLKRTIDKKSLFRFFPQQLQAL